MSAPVYIARSTRAEHAEISGGVPNELTLSYMADIQAGDFLLIGALLTFSASASIGSITKPAEFENMGVSASFNDDLAQYAGNIAMFSRIADGTESGTVELSAFSDVGNVLAAQMYQFREASGRLILVGSSSTKSNGDGDSTITLNAITVNGSGRTLVGFVAGDISSVAFSGYEAESVNTGMELHVREDVASDGAVTSSGGGSNGWATAHLSLYSPGGRSFIVN